VAFAGAALSFASKGNDTAGTATWFGDLLGIAAGAAWGATTVAVRGSKLSDAPASITLLYQLVGAFLLACGAAMALGQTSVHMTSALVASLGYQAIVVSVFSYLTWFMLLRSYLASRLGVLTFVTPVFGVIAGVVVLNERPGGGFILGAALIMIGILLVSGRELLAHGKKRAHRQDAMRRPL
jgi:drug/metabolite transporter (DMT)-like permease